MSHLLIVPLCQTVGEREADIKRLQEQLTEASQANEASRASQVNQNQNSQFSQASDANAASDSNQGLQEELTKLRQEVLFWEFFLIC